MTKITKKTKDFEKNDVSLLTHFFFVCKIVKSCQLSESQQHQQKKKLIIGNYLRVTTKIPSALACELTLAYTRKSIEERIFFFYTTI